MCGGGAQQTTSEYSPPKPVRKAGFQALDRAAELEREYRNVTVPTQQVAGFTPDQMRSFESVRNAQGAWQPYFNKAAGYAESAANPITKGDIEGYLNPWSDYALKALNNDLDSRWVRNQGNMVNAAGGVGADRIAVGQAEEGRQNNLARGQLMGDFWARALAAAQQGKGREAQAATQFFGLGQGTQGASYTDAQALYGSGTAQQGLDQMRMNADYAAAMANQDAPWKNVERLSNVVGRTGPVMGGKTTNTYPAPDRTGQIAGAGMAALGVATGNPMLIAGGVSAMGGGGGGGGGGMGGFGSAKGGGGGVGAVPMQTGPFYGSNGAPAFTPWGVNTGGRINGYADGGSVGEMPDYTDMMLSPWQSGGVQGFAAGGSPWTGQPTVPDYNYLPGFTPPEPEPSYDVSAPGSWSATSDAPAFNLPLTAGAGPEWPSVVPPEPPALPPQRGGNNFPQDLRNPDRPVVAQPYSVQPEEPPERTLEVTKRPANDGKGFDAREVLTPEQQKAFIQAAYRPYAPPPAPASFTPRAPNSGTLSDRLLEWGLGTLAASGERDSRGLPMNGLAAIGKGGLGAISGRRKDTEIDQKNIAAEQRAKEQTEDAVMGRAKLGETARRDDLLASDRLTRDQQRALRGNWLEFNYTDPDRGPGLRRVNKNMANPTEENGGIEFIPGGRKEGSSTGQERLLDRLQKPVNKGGEGLSLKDALEVAKRPGSQDDRILKKEAAAARNAANATRNAMGQVDPDEYERILERYRRAEGLPPRSYGD